MNKFKWAPPTFCLVIKSNTNDVNIVIDKIIQYETTTPDEKPWFNTMVGIGGRTFSLFDGLDQFQAREGNSTHISEYDWQEFVPRMEILARVDVKISQTFSGSPNLILMGAGWRIHDPFCFR